MSDVKLAVPITAVDDTAKGANAASKRFSQVAKSAGKIGEDKTGAKRFSQQIVEMEKAASSLFGRKSVTSGLGERVSSIGKLAGGFRSGGVGSLAGAAEGAEGVEAAEGGLGALGGALGVAASGAALFAGAAVAAAAAAYAAVDGFAKTAADRGRLSLRSGQSTEDLSAADELGARYGLGKGEGERTLAAFARRLNNAPVGDDPVMAGLLSEFHISVKRDKDGNPDATDAMAQFAGVLADMKNAPRREELALRAGLDPYLPALVKGKDEFNSEIADARANAPKTTTPEGEQGQRVEYKKTQVMQRVALVANRAEAAGMGVEEGAADLALKGAAKVSDISGQAGGFIKHAAGEVGHALEGGAHVVESGFGKVATSLKAVVGTIESVAREAGVSAKQMLTTARIESHFNADAHAKSSSAAGLYQFLDKSGAAVGVSGDARYDPRQSAMAYVREMARDLPKLEHHLGRKADDWEVYLLHQQGLGGAMKMLTGDMNRRAVDVLGKKQVLNNGGTADMTLGDFDRLWERRYRAADQANDKQGVYKMADAVAPAAQPAALPPSASLAQPAALQTPAAPGQPVVQPTPAQPAPPVAKAEVTLKLGPLPPGTVTTVSSGPDVNVNVQRSMTGG